MYESPRESLPETRAKAPKPPLKLLHVVAELINNPNYRLLN